MAWPREATKQWLKDTQLAHENERGLWDAARHKYEEMMYLIAENKLDGNKVLFLKRFGELGLIVSRGDGVSRVTQDLLEDSPIGAKK